MTPSGKGGKGGKGKTKAGGSRVPPRRGSAGSATDDAPDPPPRRKKGAGPDRFAQLGEEFESTMREVLDELRALVRLGAILAVITGAHTLEAQTARAAAPTTAAPAAPATHFPDQLLGDALTRRCSPVIDTTAYPGLTDPLFRYGVYEAGRDTLKKASAAYWCDMPTAERQVSLVIWRAWGNGPVPGGCVDVIPYQGGAGGLRFERRGTMNLLEARLVDEPAKKGPRVTARGTVITSEYDGRTVRFLCHTGRWYFTRTP